MSWNFTATPTITYAAQQQARNTQQTITECTIGCLHVIKCAEFRGPVSIESLSVHNLSVTNLSVTNLLASNWSFSTISTASGTFGDFSATNGVIQNLSVQNLYVSNLNFTTVSASNGSFGSLSASSGSFGSLSASSGSFGSLSASNGSFNVVSASVGLINNLSCGAISASNGSFGVLSVVSFYNEALSSMSYLHWQAIQTVKRAVPHANFYSTTTQTVSADNVQATVSFNVQPIVNNSFLQLSGTRIYSQLSGTLNIDFTYQFYNGGGGGSGDLVTVWLAKNGSALSNSGNQIHVPTNGRDVAYSGGAYVPVNAGDFIELCWATDNHSAIQAHYVPASDIYPATPSVKCDVHYLLNM